jgi:hypothetical protein
MSEATVADIESPHHLSLLARLAQRLWLRTRRERALDT